MKQSDKIRKALTETGDLTRELNILREEFDEERLEHVDLQNRYSNKNNAFRILGLLAFTLGFAYDWIAPIFQLQHTPGILPGAGQLAVMAVGIVLFILGCF